MVLKYRQFLKSSNLRRGLFRFVGDFVAAGMDEFEFKSPCKSIGERVWRFETGLLPTYAIDLRLRPLPTIRK
jgi:hypothetical protein